MPRLKCYFIEIEHDEPAVLLQQALAAIFPHGQPAGLKLFAHQAPDVGSDVGSDVELANDVDETEEQAWADIAAAYRARQDDDEEDTALEPPPDAKPAQAFHPLAKEAPRAAAPAPSRPATPIGQHADGSETVAPETKPLRRVDGAVGKLEQGRLAAIEYLRQHGPATRSAVAAACGIAKGSTTMVFSDSRFRIDGRGLLALADAPDRAAAPAAVNPKLSQGQQKKLADTLQTERSGANEAREEVYALLSLEEPQTLRQLARQTKFGDAYLRQLLSHEWFAESPAGFSIARTGSK